MWNLPAQPRSPSTFHLRTQPKVPCLIDIHARLTVTSLLDLPALPKVTTLVGSPTDAAGHNFLVDITSAAEGLISCWESCTADSHVS